MWKVGELAKETGLTVRTLHHYDEIGLLSPSIRTESGHRIYSEPDVARLQQVMSLKELGIPLKDIAALLQRPEFDLEGVLRIHQARLREEVVALQQMAEKLDGLIVVLKNKGEVTAERLFEAIQELAMYEQVKKHYTPEQLAKLAERREAMGEEAMLQAQRDWEKLIADARALAYNGANPSSKEGQAVARRWKELIEAFTGGDAGIAHSLNKVVEKERDMYRAMGIDDKVEAFVREAMAHVQ